MTHKRLPPQSLIDRRVTDENFAHCIGLFPPLLLWAEGVREGHRINYNDVNMVHLPVEMLAAFIRQAADGDGPLAEASREAIKKLAEIRALYAGAAT